MVIICGCSFFPRSRPRWSFFLLLGIHSPQLHVAPVVVVVDLVLVVEAVEPPSLVLVLRLFFVLVLVLSVCFIGFVLLVEVGSWTSTCWGGVGLPGIIGGWGSYGG
jgi:hypothetical protein